MLSVVRTDVAARLAEVRQLLDLVRQLEAIPPVPDPPEARILRALFFVHLYAALEFTINQGVQRLLQEVDKLNAQSKHFEAKFHSIVLDGSFNSIRDVGEDKRWSTRVKLIDQQSSSEVFKLNPDIFYLYLQNIWVEKLETLFFCLNIDEPVVPDPTYRLYVDELVEMRNGIAHGRFSALGIGGRFRLQDLANRLAAITATCTHILDCFDEHRKAAAFLIAAQRNAHVVI